MAQVPHVALLIETSRAYGRALLRGVARYTQEHGPWSIFFQPHGLGDPPPAWLKRWRGDGILARVSDPHTADAILATGVPTIDLRGLMTDLPMPFIGADNNAVAALAAGHLLERGLRHFAFYGRPRGQHPHMDQRCDAFAAELKTNGFDCEIYQHTRSAADGWERQQERLAQWLASLPRPVGLMTCHDDCGQQVLDACIRANLHVPDDIAVISVDNDEHLCGLSRPPLTSIDPNAERIGYEAAALLDRMMAGEPAPKQPTYITPRRVVTRESTDVVAIDDAELALALRYIRDHACDGIGVEDVLNVVPVSRSVLERRFRARLHRSPKAQIIRVRLERAQTLLTETDMPLAEVARKCGFGQMKYFSEAFRKKIGVPPGQYRAKNRVHTA